MEVKTAKCGRLSCKSWHLNEYKTQFFVLGAAQAITDVAYHIQMPKAHSTVSGYSVQAESRVCHSIRLPGSLVRKVRPIISCVGLRFTARMVLLEFLSPAGPHL